jgi:hypothetical protein
MRTTLYVCLLAGAMALPQATAAPFPLTGVWEGKKDGVKATTLKVEETGGKIRLNAVFYIIQDEGSGNHVGTASEALSAEGSWNGHKLEFTIIDSNGDRVPFEMTTTGSATAELKRLPANGQPGMTIPLVRPNKSHPMTCEEMRKNAPASLAGRNSPGPAAWGSGVVGAMPACRDRLCSSLALGIGATRPWGASSRAK